MKKIILLLSFAFPVSVCFSQLNYQPVNAINAASTYTSIGTNGSAISTANTDDANSTPQPIGFTFNYNGLNFTDFIFNTNGFIKLGSVAPNSAAIFGTSAQDATGSILLMSAANYPANSNCIAAFNMDLQGTGSTEYRVFTSGSAPNRVCTIEWKNVQEKTTTPAQQMSSIDFQIKLYESTNVIEILFANFVATTNTDAFKTASTGLVGTDITTPTNVVYVRKGSTAAWTAASFENGGTVTTQIFNVRRTVLPDNGRTFRFFPTYANDLSVVRIETLGKIAGYSFPHVIKALIKNTGSNAVAAGTTVSLAVSGANTYTNTKLTNALASGATQVISFDAVGSFNPGTNTLTVTVPSDDNTSNNTSTSTQLVNSIAVSYSDNSAITSAVGYNTSSGIIANKYGTQASGFVTGVKVFISNSSTNTGNTVYAVVLDATGTIVGQSPNYVITAADNNTYKTFNITTPPSVSFTDFYVGLAQTANATTGYYPIGYQFEATPTRTGAYYTAPLAGGALPTENTTIGRFVIEAIVSPTSTPVPVVLSNFTGKLNNSTAQLNWTTTNESNNDKFEVEKTNANNNNFNWTKIASIDAGGNNSTTKNYEFADVNLSTGKYLYRLKMIDKDGKFTYSNIVTLELSGKNLFVLNQNYPNPVKGTTQLSYQLNTDAKVNIDLFSIDGKRIATLVNESQNTGTYNFTLDCKKYSLAPGNYTYKMIVTDKNNQPLFNAAKTLIVVQ